MEAPDKEVDVIADPPFTAHSGEGILIIACLAAGALSGAAVTQPKVLAKLSGGQRTALEILILLGYASTICLGLLMLFLRGRVS